MCVRCNNTLSRKQSVNCKKHENSFSYAKKSCGSHSKSCSLVAWTSSLRSVSEAGSRLVAHSSKYYNITTTLQKERGEVGITESRNYGIRV